MTGGEVRRFRDGSVRRHPVANVLDAIDNRGPNPAHHVQTWLRHRAEWPALWEALDQLRAEYRPDAEPTPAETPPAVIHVLHHDDYENQAPIAAYTDPARAADLLAFLHARREVVDVTAVPLDAPWTLTERHAVTRAVSAVGDGSHVWVTERCDALAPAVEIGGQALDRIDNEWSTLDAAGWRQLPTSPAVTGHHDAGPTPRTTIRARAEAATVARAIELADAQLVRAFERAGIEVEGPTP